MRLLRAPVAPGARAPAPRVARRRVEDFGQLASAARSLRVMGRPLHRRLRPPGLCEWSAVRQSQNGPERERFSDPDATWGHRSAVSTRKGGGFYGYRVHAAICSRTGLPVAWRVETARANESLFTAPLIDAARSQGFAVETCALDRGYDLTTVYDALENRDCRPIIPVRQTTAVKRGDHKPPRCKHGEWRFAGSDYKRKASKWRCPTGECIVRLKPLDEVPTAAQFRRSPPARRRPARSAPPHAAPRPRRRSCACRARPDTRA